MTLIAPARSLLGEHQDDTIRLTGPALRIHRWDERRDGPVTEGALQGKLTSLGYDLLPFVDPHGAIVSARIHPCDRADAVPGRSPQNHDQRRVDHPHGRRYRVRPWRCHAPGRTGGNVAGAVPRSRLSPGQGLSGRLGLSLLRLFHLASRVGCVYRLRELLDHPGEGVSRFVLLAGLHVRPAQLHQHAVEREL